MGVSKRSLFPMTNENRYIGDVMLKIILILIGSALIASALLILCMYLLLR